MDGAYLVKPAAQGADQPPSSHGSPYCNRRRTERNHPHRDFKLIDGSADQQAERNNAHCLLSIIRPMAEGHSQGRDKLSAFEEFIDFNRRISNKKIDQAGERKPESKTKQGRGKQGDDHFFKTMQFDCPEARTRQDRAKHASNQGVR